MATFVVEIQLRIIYSSQCDRWGREEIGCANLGVMWW